MLAGLFLGAAVAYAILQLFAPSGQQARLRSAAATASESPTAAAVTPEATLQPAATPTAILVVEPRLPAATPTVLIAEPAGVQAPAHAALSATPTAAAAGLPASLLTPVPTSRVAALPAANRAGTAGSAPVIARAPSFLAPSKVTVSIGCPIPANICPLLRPVYDSTGVFLGFGVQVPQGTPILAAVSGAANPPTYAPLAGVEVTALTIPSPAQDFGVNYTVAGHLTPGPILRRGDPLGAVGAGRLDFGPRVVAPMNVFIAVSKRSSGQPLLADQIAITSV